MKELEVEGVLQVLANACNCGPLLKFRACPWVKCVYSLWKPAERQDAHSYWSFEYGVKE